MVGGKEVYFAILEFLQFFLAAFCVFYCFVMFLLKRRRKTEIRVFSLKREVCTQCLTPSLFQRSCVMSIFSYNVCKYCYEVYIYLFTSPLLAKTLLQVTHTCVNLLVFL